MEVAQFGPRELRVVKDQTWCLPVFCDPYTADTRSVTHWSVRPALQLLAAPFSELSKRFSPMNLGSATSFWIITDEQLNATTQRVSGCMPKDYLSWESKEPGKETVGLEISTVNDKDEEFLRFCCNRASIDLPLGRYVWRAIKEGIQHWMINGQRPIDFELFTLVPLPYRANWKEILLAKHLSCYKVFRKGRARWKKELVEMGFVQDMGSSDLLSMNKNKTFNWVIEVVPGKLWEDSVKKAEIERLAHKGPLNYARYYESILRRRFDDILTSFHTWICSVCNPVALLRQSTHGSGSVLVPVNKKKSVTPNRYRPPVTNFQVDEGGARLIQGQLDRPKRVSKTLSKMLEVSSVSPPTRNLRQCNEPNPDGRGASGLLLSDANESQAGGG